jgi:hypothetical protein
MELLPWFFLIRAGGGGGGGGGLWSPRGGAEGQHRFCVSHPGPRLPAAAKKTTPISLEHHRKQTHELVTGDPSAWVL